MTYGTAAPLLVCPCDDGNVEINVAEKPGEDSQEGQLGQVSRSVIQSRIIFPRSELEP
jgi:hypothetical protein